MQNENESMQDDEFENLNDEDFDLDKLEKSLQADINESLDNLDFLENEKKNIRNPDALGKVIQDTIFDQVNMQLGVSSGKQFIEKNNGLTADLRKDAHIQTTENFEQGEIATHNQYIDYQKRYDDWQNNFQKDENGNIIQEYDKIDKEVKPKLKQGYRKPYDDGRKKGSAAIHIDETVPVAEQVRDAEANAHLSLEERVKFDQSDKNLNPLDSSANCSKSDHKMKNWLESERDGKKPSERFNIDEEQLREKDKEARTEYKKVKEEGKQRSIKTGKASQRKEAFLLGTQALTAAVRSLLVGLIREIIGSFITWLKSVVKKLQTFLDSMKSAIHNFVSKLKTYISNAAESTGLAIVTAIFAPIGKLISSVFRTLKQGISSIKEAINYLRNPENKKKAFPVIALELSKIVIAGLSTMGGFVLSEVIEKGLLALSPVIFGFQIPLFGSIANIIGIFMGALIAGLVGAIVLNFIDKIIAKKREQELTGDIIEKQNEIIDKQSKLIAVKEAKVEKKSKETALDITERHNSALKETCEIMENAKSLSDETEQNANDVEKNHKLIQESEKNSKDSGDDFDNLMDMLGNL